jgi:hypothetical protein
LVHTPEAEDNDYKIAQEITGNNPSPLGNFIISSAI